MHQGGDRASAGSMGGVSSGESFVNHRLAAWEAQRAAWVAAGKTARDDRKRPRRPVLSADATYDDLLTSSRPFSAPVPLPEMVEFLQEVWDEEGLYD